MDREEAAAEEPMGKRGEDEGEEAAEGVREGKGRRRVGNHIYHFRPAACVCV